MQNLLPKKLWLNFSTRHMLHSLHVVPVLLLSLFWFPSVLWISLPGLHSWPALSWLGSSTSLLLQVSCGCCWRHVSCTCWCVGSPRCRSSRGMVFLDHCSTCWATVSRLSLLVFLRSYTLTDMVQRRGGRKYHDQRWTNWWIDWLLSPFLFF